jgi:hypothetical protein
MFKVTDVDRNELCRATNIVNAVKSWSLRWVAYEAEVEEKRMHTEFCCRHLLGNVHLIDQEGSERTELRLITEQALRIGSGWNCFNIMTNGGFWY